MMLALLAAPAVAQASDRWIADATESRAALPLPAGSNKIGAATLSCAAQKWTLALDLPGVEGLEAGSADMRFDRASFSVTASATAAALAIAVPREALESLKRGVRWTIDFSGALEDAVGDLTFSLRGSRIAITAMEGSCTPRDMSAYQAVSLTPHSSHIELARNLREADMQAFTAATTAQARLDAAMVEFGYGRRVLFTRLCGSSWYFGATGCNVTGFAPGDGATTAKPWRIVYDTENVHLYTDPKSAETGWRDIVTLPVGTVGSGKVWRWSGAAYVLHGDLPGEEESEPLPLRLSQE